MVMTSDMYHILFEKPRENEYIYVLNNIRVKKIDKRKLDALKNVDIAKAN